MSEQITIFARIRPYPDHAHAVRAAVLAIVPATRAESGCQLFEVYEAQEHDGCLYLYEIWDDETALAAHHAQPYTQDVFERYRVWLSEPVAITTLRRIE